MNLPKDNKALSLFAQLDNAVNCERVLCPGGWLESEMHSKGALARGSAFEHDSVLSTDFSFLLL